MSKKLAAVIISLALVVAGGAVLKGAYFARHFVHEQLTQQQIAFPTVAADRSHYAAYPELRKYAGRPVLDGWTANAYAKMIAEHVSQATGGKTYSQVSAEALANPNNADLQEARRTALDGQLLRSTLLNVYGWWWIGTIALWIGWFVVGIGGAALIGLAALALRRAGFGFRRADPRPADAR